MANGRHIAVAEQRNAHYVLTPFANISPVSSIADCNAPTTQHI
jgi:hypothetical protein